MTTQQVELTKYDEIRQDQAAIGRQYPAEYVGDLAEKALDQVTKWLREKETPEDVIQLMDAGVYLNMIYYQMRADDLSSNDAAELVTLIPDTLCKIADLVGGKSIFGQRKARKQNGK